MNDCDLLTGADVAHTIQGHVGPSTKQVFETLQGTPFSQPRLKLAGYEFLLRDQFGNYYHKMRAVLFDGELYDIDQHIKPSMMMKRGGGHADFEDKYAKARLRITEDLLKELREIGAVALGRANIEIIKGRQLSSAPVAIETKDITHQANILEDQLTRAVETAKVNAGEKLQVEPLAPDGFKPLKVEKAPKGQKLAEVVAFPVVDNDPKPDVQPKP